MQPQSIPRTENRYIRTGVLRTGHGTVNQQYFNNNKKKKKPATDNKHHFYICAAAVWKKLREKHPVWRAVGSLGGGLGKVWEHPGL